MNSPSTSKRIGVHAVRNTVKTSKKDTKSSPTRAFPKLQRETVDEDKHVRRRPESRQSVVENPWIDNSMWPPPPENLRSRRLHCSVSHQTHNKVAPAETTTTPSTEPYGSALDNRNSNSPPLNHTIRKVQCRRLLTELPRGDKTARGGDDADSDQSIGSDRPGGISSWTP